MGLVNNLIFKIKRSNSPVFRLAKRIIRFLFFPTIPPLPRALIAPLRFVYEMHFLAVGCFRSLVIIFYSNPLFQARCASFGRNVSIGSLPFVSGHVEIHIGDDVQLGGKVTILSGAVFTQPKLVIKDRTAVGWNTIISINQEVVIEEDVILSYDCRVSDTDGHCREADLRAAGVPPDPKDIKPVRICRYAFIGNGSHIMKGVTVGEGAIVASNSVVISNVPPYSLAIGNPAEIVFRNYGRPSTARKKKAAPDKPEAQAEARPSESVSGVPTVDN
jgi:acetyltransferase-like isoleucine patch superfamily enzyme